MFFKNTKNKYIFKKTKTPNLNINYEIIKINFELKKANI